MAKGSEGDYRQQLNPLLDMDLRDAGMRARYDVPNGWGEAEKARLVAIDKINWWLRELGVRRVSFVPSDFDITLETRSVLTGKGQTPVEWQARKAGEYRGESGEWVAQVDFDDPPKDKDSASLKVPHVGYGIAFLRISKGKPVIELIGHLVVSENALEACRPHPRDRSWFKVRTRQP